MSTPWSAQQMRVLAALGHAVYRPLAGWTNRADAAVAPGTATGNGVLDANLIDVNSIDASDALVLAVLRAAGLDARACPDIDGWWRAHRVPSPTALRADATAKRALWPRLRALRAGRR